MAKTARSSQPNEKAYLSGKHARIDARIVELDARRALTSTEEDELRMLKKQKLAAKDQLEGID